MENLYKIDKECYIQIELVNCSDLKIKYLVQGYYLCDFYYSLDQNILKYEYNDTTENTDFLSKQDKRKIKKYCLKFLYNEYNKFKKEGYILKQLKKINKYLKPLEYYEKKKAELAEQAKDYQRSWANYCYSYGELAEISDYFYKQGKRYGLIKEFKENCIL